MRGLLVAYVALILATVFIVYWAFTHPSERRPEVKCDEPIKLCILHHKY